MTGAAVADAFPAPTLTGVTWSCVSAGGACGAASGAGDIMTTVDLPAGASAMFTVTGSVAADATGTLVNTATVTAPSGTTDPNLANNSATASTPILALADVAVTKVGPQKVIAGNTLAFTIEVTNNGPSVATSVTVDDTTPPGLTFVSNTGDCTTPFQCSLGTMAPNTSRTITSTFMVPAGYTTPDPIVNVVTATSQTVDPAPGNNTAEAAVSLNAPVAALAVTKSDGKTQVIAGTTTVYTITVSNPGPSAVTGVHVTDPLPAELANASWTCVGSGGGSCTAASGTGSIDTTVALPVGAVATFKLTATVAQDAPGSGEQHGDGAESAELRQSLERICHGHERGDPARGSVDHEIGPDGAGGAGAHGRLHDRRDEWRSVGRDGRDGGGPDADGPHLRVQLGRLHDAVPVRPRRARVRCVADHHHDVPRAPRLHDAQPDRRDRHRVEPRPRPGPGQQQRHGR